MGDHILQEMSMKLENTYVACKYFRGGKPNMALQFPRNNRLNIQRELNSENVLFPESDLL